ncbi:MAG: hypothetical protein JXB50_14875 [Spirochaetes bacterium]|nr:hypothetical protein [Spirochaetota bacterium]
MKNKKYIIIYLIFFLFFFLFDLFLNFKYAQVVEPVKISISSNNTDILKNIEVYRKSIGTKTSQVNKKPIQSNIYLWEDKIHYFTQLTIKINKKFNLKNINNITLEIGKSKYDFNGINSSWLTEEKNNSYFISLNLEKINFKKPKFILKSVINLSNLNLILLKTFFETLFIYSIIFILLISQLTEILSRKFNQSK